MNVTKTQTEFNVNLNGADATVKNENGTDKYDKGDNAIITITPAPGYTYSVIAVKTGTEEAVTVTNNGNNTYTIANIQSDITITVTKTLKGIVAVNQYIQLQNGSKMFLVTYTDTLPDDHIPYYNDNGKDNAMFWSDVYNAYCYLVIVPFDYDAQFCDLTTENAFKQISIKSGNKTTQTIVYTCNVNGSTLTDAADAQLVYDMYMAQYQDFTTVSMKKFLLADVNGDKKVDTTDATAIISEVLGLSSEG